jgi:hypothetical protein
MATRGTVAGTGSLGPEPDQKEEISGRRTSSSSVGWRQRHGLPLSDSGAAHTGKADDSELTCGLDGRRATAERRPDEK